MSMVGNKFGVTRIAVWQFVERHAEVKAILPQCLEAKLDDAEEALMELVGKRNIAAICFTLKCQGKARGYIERPELDTKNLTNAELAEFARLLNKAAGTPEQKPPTGPIRPVEPTISPEMETPNP